MPTAAIDSRDRLIGLIYEAATQERLWTKALQGLADFCGAPEVCLIGLDKDLASHTSGFSFVSGRLYSPEAHRLYRSYYAQFDLMRIRGYSWPVGELAFSCNLIREEEVRNNEYFQDFLIPNGGGHMAGWSLVNDSNTLTTFCFHSNRDNLFQRDFDQVWTLAKHVERSLRIWSIVSRRANEVERRQVILETEGVAYFVVDSCGMVAECSKHASQVLERGRPLGIRHDGRLFLSTHQESKRFHQLIVKACRGSGGGILRVADSGLGTYFIQIAPLGVNDEPGLGLKRSGCALVVIRSLIPHDRRWLSSIRDALSCTRAEAEIALALGSGLTPTQIAKTRTVSINTIRTQIQRLLTNADVRRIADLVSLLNLIR